MVIFSRLLIKIIQIWEHFLCISTFCFLAPHILVISVSMNSNFFFPLLSETYILCLGSPSSNQDQVNVLRQKFRMIVGLFSFVLIFLCITVMHYFPMPGDICFLCFFKSVLELLMVWCLIRWKLSMISNGSPWYYVVQII